jgi:hypothetical protein
MAKTLGILVCTTKYFSHVMGLAEAAHRAGVETSVFVTGDATALTQHPSFSELSKVADVKVCNVSYNRLGFTGIAPGLDAKDHTNQLENALIVSQTDKYLVF